MATMTMNLNDAVGQVVRIEGYRGDDKVRIGEVVAVRDLLYSKVSKRTHEERVMARDRYLLTVKLSSGEHRAYYVGLCDKVEVLTPTQRFLLAVRNALIN